MASHIALVFDNPAQTDAADEMVCHMLVAYCRQQSLGDRYAHSAERPDERHRILRGGLMEVQKPPV